MTPPIISSQLRAALLRARYTSTWGTVLCEYGCHCPWSLIAFTSFLPRKPPTSGIADDLPPLPMVFLTALPSFLLRMPSSSSTYLTINVHDCLIEHLRGNDRRTPFWIFPFEIDSKENLPMEMHHSSRQIPEHGGIHLSSKVFASLLLLPSC